MLKKAVRRFGVAAIAVAGLNLTACGGGGGGGGGPLPTSGPTSGPTFGPTPTPPPATPTPGPPTPSGKSINAQDGFVNGTPGLYTPPFGDTPAGGQGQTVDGIPCFAQPVINYHIHAFLGVYDNGTYVAQPYGTGMKDPQPPVNGFVDAAACFYSTHTHDSSGIIHIEDASTTPNTASLFTLKTYLDIWGITADSKHFGPFQGPVRVFTSGQMFRPTGKALIPATTYTFYGQDPNNIPLYSHEIIWIEVGPNFPASLPNIQYFF